MIENEMVKRVLWRQGLLHALGATAATVVGSANVSVWVFPGTMPTVANLQSNWSTIRSTALSTFTTTLQELQLGKYFIAPSLPQNVTVSQAGIATWALIVGDPTNATNLATATTIAPNIDLVLVTVSDTAGTSPLKLNTTNLTISFHVTEFGFRNIL